VHVVRGKVEVAGNLLQSGDAAAVKDETEITLSGREKTEVLLFDLA
jgi:redox-sensitive bicupin YhaK (pirin superfamily)